MGAFFNYYRGGSSYGKRQTEDAPVAQHFNARRNKRRAAIKAAGGIRQFKRRAHAAQGHRNG